MGRQPSEGEPTLLPLPPDVAERLRSHCRAQYPDEACGAVFGLGDGVTTPWRVTEVAEAPNQHGDDRRRRYLVPPDFQFRAEEHADATDQEVLGYYHSHPDHPARPSDYDVEHALPEYLYLICAVDEGQPTDLNAFTLNEQGDAFLDVAVREALPDE